MSDRHFELPARPNLEYYRKQAKSLHRGYATGDATAGTRVTDVLGDRAAERFLLSDAQFVLAQEHGFRTWAAFREDVESRAAAGERPVARLRGLGPGVYTSMADALLEELRRGDNGALRRLRAYVPRHATATSAANARLRDARLVIARELGFPTWRELVSFTEKSRRDRGEHRERRRLLHREAGALLAGDTDHLASLGAGQADTLLEMLAAPELVPGVRLGKELGVPRAAVVTLLGRATCLDVPLTLAARNHRVAYLRLLLEAGADPGTRALGATPLENAALLGDTESVDVLAGHGILPRTLWLYAACDRLDLVRACFDAEGGLRRDAAPARPDLADTGAGFPSRLPPTDDPEEIVGEAFVHACQHGRIEVVRWFLDRGVHPDVAPYLGRTGLHWAIPGGRVEVVRLLLARGADPSVRDDLLKTDAYGWLRLTTPWLEESTTFQH
ncbi:ankyrin repeat domain-containing protein [Nonomuraea sp. NPDC050790]|uniref:ankyrin repeat domain-containing protein n=1 Tax=Nonomuraea sp. NPDC050790 TaxID=3364371 RepID=UPI00378B893A